MDVKQVLSTHELWLRGKPGGERANLYEANLREADLRGADLRGANLWGTNLREANLREADLREANLWRANLREANLRGANLREADLPHFQIPQQGTLIVYKKVERVLVTLRIPASARRTASLIGRKCRAEYADVIDTEGREFVVSDYDKTTMYRVGETVRPDRYDDDIRVECTNGIHFFLTREEAMER